MLVYRVLDDGFVLVVDGEGRSVAKPKRKNPRHLQPHSLVADELGAKWRRGETADERRSPGGALGPRGQAEGGGLTRWQEKT